MLNKLKLKIVSWLYDLLEEEKKRRDQAVKFAQLLKRDTLAKETAAKNEKLKKDRQDKCSHLKGGHGLKYDTDYNIWDHHFPDGTRTVRCLTCNKEWKKEQLKSEEVLYMLKNTTNERTVSEYQHEYKDRNCPVGCAEGSDNISDFDIKLTTASTIKGLYRRIIKDVEKKQGE